MLKDLGNLFMRCPVCHHLNITDEDFYEITCPECHNVFLNESNTNHLWDYLLEN